MVDYTPEMFEIIEKLERWRSWKNPPGTKIFYAEKRLNELKELQRKSRPKIERKTLSQTPRVRKKAEPTVPRDYPRNRAYVLSGETYDLTRALVALERLRRDNV